MIILIFFLVAIALISLTIPLLKEKKIAPWTWLIILITSIIISINTTHRTCQDGWTSSNIGDQGACSGHGGVVTKLNNFGWVILTLSLIIIIIACFAFRYEKKKKNK